jgi:ABC-type branched-subunit amino acid transport system ATPase component
MLGIGRGLMFQPQNLMLDEPSLTAGAHRGRGHLPQIQEVTAQGDHDLANRAERESGAVGL